MKNKKFMRTFLVMMAVVFSMTAFSVTAYAGGGEEHTEPPVVQEPEPKPAPIPLTPEGNLSLVDDIEDKTAEDKQFITVVSKSGNTFYIIIDRAVDGENTVHFLNQVDEADLMALTEDGKTETAPELCTCAEKCTTSSVNLNCALCKTNTAECAGKEPKAEEPEQEETAKKGGNPLLILLVLLVLGGGGAFAYVKFLKPKQATKGNDSLDDLEFEDEYEDTEVEYLDDELEQEDNE